MGLKEEQMTEEDAMSVQQRTQSGFVGAMAWVTLCKAVFARGGIINDLVNDVQASSPMCTRASTHKAIWTKDALRFSEMLMFRPLSLSRLMFLLVHLLDGWTASLTCRGCCEVFGGMKPSEQRGFSRAEDDEPKRNSFYWYPWCHTKMEIGNFKPPELMAPHINVFTAKVYVLTTFEQNLFFAAAFKQPWFFNTSYQEKKIITSCSWDKVMDFDVDPDGDFMMIKIFKDGFLLVLVNINRPRLSQL